MSNKPIKIFFLHFVLIGIFFLFSCNEKTSIKEKESSLKQKEDLDDNIDKVNDAKPITLSEIEIKKYLEKVLKINNKEIYDYEIKKGHLNNDQIEDAIITVNRYEFAKQEAVNSKNMINI